MNNTDMSIDMKVISKVANNVDLQEIYLLKSECNRFNEALEKINKGEWLFNIQSQAKNVEPVKERKIQIIANFRLEVINSEDTNTKSNEAIFFISASFVLVYNLKTDNIFSNDDLNMFANINGKFNCWPYWREFVQNTSVRMGFPPLTIPLFKIPTTRTKKPKTNKQI